uniref:Uncharacterized protein n=1 Tax=Arundo donax TaxID=35708 RepID=A0A0A8YJN3_ARUDO
MKNTEISLTNKGCSYLLLNIGCTNSIPFTIMIRPMQLLYADKNTAALQQK